MVSNDDKVGFLLELMTRMNFDHYKPTAEEIERVKEYAKDEDVVDRFKDYVAFIRKSRSNAVMKDFTSISSEGGSDDIQ